MLSKRHAPLLIAIRCHDYPEFVLDTVDSVFHYAVSAPHVVLAIDCGPGKDTRRQTRIANTVLAHFPQVSVFKAPEQFGWGAGMYCLLCDTIKWARARLRFKHFLSLDYDAIFIKEGADHRMLKDAEQKRVGLVASNNGPSRHWSGTFQRKWAKIKEITGGAEPSAGLWRRGSSVLGSMMLLTGPCIAKMDKEGYLSGRFRDMRRTLRLSDDAWVRFLVALAGFRTVTNRSYVYNVWSNPQPYTEVLRQGSNLYAWHPTKMAAGGRPVNRAAERNCRNWFRARRGKKPLK